MVAWGTYGDKDLLQGEILVRVAHAGMHMQGTASAGTRHLLALPGFSVENLKSLLPFLKKHSFETNLLQIYLVCLKKIIESIRINQIKPLIINSLIINSNTRHEHSRIHTIIKYDYQNLLYFWIIPRKYFILVVFSISKLDVIFLFFFLILHGGGCRNVRDTPLRFEDRTVRPLPRSIIPFPSSAHVRSNISP